MSLRRHIINSAFVWFGPRPKLKAVGRKPYCTFMVTLLADKEDPAAIGLKAVENHIEWHHCPLPPIKKYQKSGAFPDQIEAQIERIVALIWEACACDECVFVHCAAGQDRTGEIEKRLLAKETHKERMR